MTLNNLTLFASKKFIVQVFTLITVFLFTSSCTKDKVAPEEVMEGPACPNGYDTLIVDIENSLDESSNWLAAYPGSWWELSNGDILTCSLDEFEITEFVENNEDDCVAIYNNTL